MRICVGLLCIASMFVVLPGPLKAKSGADDLQRHSQGPSYPGPFNSAGDWQPNQPAVSTGYYVIDSQDPNQSKLAPNASALFQDLNSEPETWFRVTSGPNQFSASHWQNNPDGHSYFRNPGDMQDSTDNAFAGPISLGFAFHVNGVRYDSVYISTNGLLAFSNRRYHYNAQTGARTIPAGTETAWDPQSDDTRSRTDQNDSKGLSDAVADDWGYLEVACGGDVNDPLGGIRDPRNGALTTAGINAGKLQAHAPIFAPFWDDWQLSQSDGGKKDDYGQVWIKRWKNADKLTIYFGKLMPIGNKKHPHLPGQTVNYSANIRPNDNNLAFAINAQITLDASDNSFTVVYEQASPDKTTLNNRELDSWAVVRENATVGIRGTARYKDAQGAEQRYVQHTEYLRNGQVFAADAVSFAAGTPANEIALSFKQHKNILRLHDVDYLIPGRTGTAYSTVIEDPQNHELLVGHAKLGSIRPRIIVQNVSNDIQGIDGVNYQRQDVVLRARYTVVNELNGKTVFSEVVCIDRAALSNPDVSGVRLVNAAGVPQPFSGNGLAPYEYAQVTFPAYTTLAGLEDQVGRFKATVSVSAENCNGSTGTYAEVWTLDNQQDFKLFGIQPLKVGANGTALETGESHSVLEDGRRVPLVSRWINVGAEIVEGEDLTFRPSAPRSNVREFYGERPQKDVLSPVIRMNRIVDGVDAAPFGDELISSPIDLSGQERAVLTFSYQRTGIPPSGDYARGWSDAVLVGPEARVVEAGNTMTTEPLRVADRLEVLFANPSPDGYDNIVNIPDDGWSVHPRASAPNNPITDNPAFTVLGGGGYAVGFSENDADSAVTRAGGLRPVIFDTGKDREFRKACVEIPSYILDAANDGDKYFRYKFRVLAERNSSAPGPVDDLDDFFIDNIQVLGEAEVPELEAISIRVKQPYEAIPASQAEAMPLEVKIANNSLTASRSFIVFARIGIVDDKWDNYLYCRTKTIPFLRAKTESYIRMPDWNARQTKPGTVRMKVSLRIPGGDPVPENDWTYDDFDLRFSEAFEYVLGDCAAVNDVPKFSGTAARGLNLSGSNSGQFTSKTAYGPVVGDGSGEFIVKFTLNKKDTLLGYQAFFGGAGQGTQSIGFRVYSDATGTPSPAVVHKSDIFAKRGLPDLDCNGNKLVTGTKTFNSYGTYLLDEEVILQPGTYFLSVVQLGTEGLHLGAHAARMGMQTTVYAAEPALGAYGISVSLDDRFLERDSQTGLLRNGNFFWYDEPFDRSFQQFSPVKGNPAFGHLNHAGEVNGYKTYSRGSWVPMLRPYFGPKSYNDPPKFLTDLPCFFLPVELAEFDGAAIPPHGIELDWVTASEINNAGFYVERRLADVNSEFSSLGFVQGAGNSTRELRYDFLDADVQRGETYEYRLRQVDFDGTVDVSRTLLLTYDYADGLEARSAPNPFADRTSINFGVPQAGHVKVEVLDMLGKPLRVLFDGHMPATQQTSIDWDTRDASGTRMPTGTYLCRLEVGSQIQVLTLHVVH